MTVADIKKTRSYICRSPTTSHNCIGSCQGNGKLPIRQTAVMNVLILKTIKIQYHTARVEKRHESYTVFIECTTNVLQTTADEQKPIQDDARNAKITGEQIATKHCWGRKGCNRWLPQWADWLCWNSHGLSCEYAIRQKVCGKVVRTWLRGTKKFNQHTKSPRASSENITKSTDNTFLGNIEIQT